jgi:hypothetical protein
MADPALTSHSDAETLTESQVDFVWSAGDNIELYELRASWDSTFTLADDTTTTKSYTLTSGRLPSACLSHDFNLPSNGETITVTLLWSSAGVAGSAAYTLTAVNQPDYQDSALYYRDDCPRWWQCERCGFQYPEDEMASDPYTGLWVCQRWCLDPAQWGDTVITLAGKRRNPRLEQG